ncbi:MAG: hypothetical protein PVI78_01840 [Anaerolineales bacterium]
MFLDGEKNRTRTRKWPYKHWVMGGSVAILLLLAACGTSTPAIPTATETVSPMNLAPTATATIEPSPTQGLSYQFTVYRDEVAGFEFDYPASWTVGPSEQYSRGGITVFSSWSRPNDVLPDETPPGETRLDVTVQLWDPVDDLDAFVAQRRLSWETSIITVISQETWVLAGDRSAEVFVVESGDGNQTFYLFATLVDKYLVLSGGGDLTLLAEIAATLR